MPSFCHRSQTFLPNKNFLETLQRPDHTIKTKTVEYKMYSDFTDQFFCFCFENLSDSASNLLARLLLLDVIWATNDYKSESSRNKIETGYHLCICWRHQKPVSDLWNIYTTKFMLLIIIVCQRASRGNTKENVSSFKEKPVPSKEKFLKKNFFPQRKIK